MTRYPAKQHFEKTISKLWPLLDSDDSKKIQILYLTGERTGYRNDTDRELLFRQESNFFWLSGCDVPGSSLVLVYDPSGHTFESHLLIPEEDPVETLWSPAPPTIEEATEISDVHHIRFTKDLEAFLETVLSKYPGALVHVLPTSPQFPSHPDITSKLTSNATSDWLLKAVHQARLIKDAYEIEMIRKANDISSRAHEVVMRLLGQGIRDLETQKPIQDDSRPLLPHEWRINKEAEAEAVFVASCRREGAFHQAYLPIVAASTRASTLHYCCNDKEFSWGPESHNQEDFSHDHDHNCLAPQVLLIDAGCEWGNYAADITRVTPVGNRGKFTEEAKAIYSLVLKMQIVCIEEAKPGVHWDILHLRSHEILIEEFLKLGIFKGNKQDVLRSGVSAAFYPHGLGHSLGLDVHDVPSASKPAYNLTIPESSELNPEFYRYLRLRIPLEENMVVTIEPGCYFSPHQLAPVRNSQYIDHDVLSRYEAVGGVRIEDVVLITANGCESLTKVRKDVEWLEAVASGRD